MKLDELIRKLGEAYLKSGNIDVYLQTEIDGTLNMIDLNFVTSGHVFGNYHEALKNKTSRYKESFIELQFTQIEYPE